jgi:hypothetical protein
MEREQARASRLGANLQRDGERRALRNNAISDCFRSTPDPSTLKPKSTMDQNRNPYARKAQA